MANELQKFNQIIANIDAQNAVHQVMEMFSTINQMQSTQLFNLVQTIDFFQKRTDDNRAIQNCKDIKRAIEMRTRSLTKGGVIIANSTESHIFEICKS